MIPFAVAPLKGVTALVTRPADQSKSLCERIEAMGGEAIPFPAIAIESLHPAATTDVYAKTYDWLVFVSVNAVKFGLPHVNRATQTLTGQTFNRQPRIAAIGKATAAALESQSIRVDATPETGSTSEALLSHPAFRDVAAQSVLIVKGAGGRELLHHTLLERGARVATLDAYRRVLPVVPADVVQTLEQRWQEAGIDVVTITSVEILDNLFSLLTDNGCERLRSTPFLTVSERIATAARSRGLGGTCVLARSADDEAIIGAIAAWHARAR